MIYFTVDSTHTAAKSFERCMIRFSLDVAVETMIEKRKVRHDFKRICLTNLDSNRPMKRTSVS